MPRFSLGSHPPQQQQQIQVQQQQQQQSIDADSNSNHTSSGSRVRRVKSWWKRVRKTFSSSQTQNFPGLSPDRPPLPPILGAINDANNNSSTTTTTSNGNARSSESNGSGRFTRAKRIAPQTESAPTSQRRHLRQSTGSIDDRTARLLYTILEESDTIMTDSSQSRARPQSLLFNDNNNNNNNSNNSNEEKRISTSSNETDSSASTTSSSAVSYHPPPVLPPSTTSATTSTSPQKREPQFRPAMVGDETKCRRKFVKMVQAAYSFQMENKDLIPKEMDIIFNAQDNVQSIRLYINGQPEYHKFCGNSQYIPPELSTHGMYNHGLADVWVLGVSLYRMLVGKYPFIASTDRKLFKKMLSADFSIPASLSEDAKDLLRRMLAPDTTRASLDLVLFHPWLKPYKVTVPSSSVDNNSMSQSPPAVTTTITTTTTTTTPPPPPSSSSTSHPGTQQDVVSEAAVVPEVVQTDKGRRQQQRHHDHQDERSLKRVLTGMMLLLVEGPFPPPKRPYQELAHLHTNISHNRPQRALAR